MREIMVGDAGLPLLLREDVEVASTFTAAPVVLLETVTVVVFLVLFDIFTLRLLQPANNNFK